MCHPGLQGAPFKEPYKTLQDVRGPEDVDHPKPRRATRSQAEVNSEGLLANHRNSLLLKKEVEVSNPTDTLSIVD